MPLRTNVSSNSGGPSFDLDVAVVDEPGPGGDSRFTAHLTVVADSSEWSLEGKIRPKPDYIHRPKRSAKGSVITIVWLSRKIHKQAKHFRFVLKCKHKEPVTGIAALAWDPALGAMAPGSWAAKPRST